MATLELVPLRSKYPYSGLMTVRFESPVIHPENELEKIDAEELHDILDGLETITTPQVDGARAGETAVRKGVQAR